MRFVFIAPCVNEDFFLPVKRAARDAAAMFEVEVAFIGTEDVDIPAQIALVDAAVESGCAGIALSMPHETAFRDIVQRTMARGVPVVGFNVDAPTTGRLACVAQRLYEAGKTFGAKALDSISPGARVLVTLHSDGISALEDRRRGMLDALAPLGVRHDSLITGIDPERARALIEERLAHDPAISAVLCTGQADTEGAGLAARGIPQASRPYVAGFDLSDRILELIGQGCIAFTIDQQPYAQGFYPVAQLALYLRHGVQPMDIDVGAIVIDASNIKAG